MSEINGNAAAKAAFAKIKSHAVGLDAEYTLATGEKTRRVYLDTTASALRLGVVHDVLEKYYMDILKPKIAMIQSQRLR